MYLVKKQNKYFAKKTEYNGVIYHSKKEAAMAQELDMRKRAGEIVDWERQIKISVYADDDRKLNTEGRGQNICNYYLDFLAYLPDGTQEWIEVKSAFTAKMDLFRFKWRLVEAIYGNDEKIKLVIVK